MGGWRPAKKYISVISVEQSNPLNLSLHDPLLNLSLPPSLLPSLPHPPTSLSFSLSSSSLSLLPSPSSQDNKTAIDLAKRGSYNEETKEWVQSEGHKACAALMEEAMNKVKHGQPPTSYDPPHSYSPTPHNT